MVRNILSTALVILLIAGAGFAFAQDDTRPFIGISFAPDGAVGITVVEVVAGSPADEAALQADDVIVTLDGAVVTGDNLAAILDEYAIGDTVELVVQRDDETIDAPLTLGERPPEPEATEEPDSAESGEDDTPRRAQLGISVGDTDDDSGVIVLSVAGGSPAAEAGIQETDVITSFGGEPVATSQELIELVRSYTPDDVVEVDLLREDETLTVEVMLGEAPPQPGDVTMVPVPDGVTFDEETNTWTVTGDELSEFGIEDGDVITAINGETVESPMDGFDLLSEAVLGDDPVLTVERDGETLEVDAPIPLLLALVATVE